MPQYDSEKAYSQRDTNAAVSVQYLPTVRNGAEKDAAMYWPLITPLNATNR
jgi:hypothetical protein